MVKKVNLIVVSQSLVVDTYRSFFYELEKISRSDESIALATALFVPQRFIELAGQVKESTPFTPPFTRVARLTRAESLRTFSLHVQAVFFFGLIGKMKKFVVDRDAEHSKNIVFAMSEPYSLTSLFVWTQSYLAFGSNFKFFCLGTQNIKKDFNFWVRSIQRFIFRKSDCIFYLGQEHRRVLRSQGYRGICNYFPLWYDRSVFYPQGRDVSSKVLRLPRTENKNERISLGFSGSLTEEKGILDLLDFFESDTGNLAKKYRLLICGDGPLKRQVQRRCRALSEQGLDTCFLGPLASRRMPFFLSSCDVLVIPSRSHSHWKEQFGRIIVEAMACSCIVIGSNSGEIPSVINNSKYIYPEGNLCAFGECLDKVRLSISEAKKTRIRSQVYLRYSDQRLAKRFFASLLKLV